MKSKMLADLQICISVPLRISGEKICITAFITIAEISFFFCRALEIPQLHISFIIVSKLSY